MQLVIADTGPVNYLILIRHIEILPALFSGVIIPSAVQKELTDPRTPPAVLNWAATPPSWVDIRRPAHAIESASLLDLGEGEAAALALAVELNADLLLIDDKQAKSVALEVGVAVTGTLGLLARAAKVGLIDLADAFELLRQTNFRYRQESLDALLTEYGGRNR